MVASILLVLGVAGTAYFALQDRANVPMYVVSSGIQKYGIRLFAGWNDSTGGSGQPRRIRQFFR